MRCGYHFSVKSVSFGKGQSAVAKAAYNAREQLDNERDGRKTKDYSEHSEVLFEGIFAPEGAPDWARNRNELWNRAEAAEKRKDGQPARNIDCAFPHQLDQQQREWLLKDFCREQFARKGMVADAVIHAPDAKSDERNFHAHILLTMRKIDGDKFAEKKSREWNGTTQLAQWKEQWAEKGAKALDRAGYPIEAERWRHGHKTLTEQYKAALLRGDKEFAEHLRDREPTRHMGPTITAMKRRGKQSDRADELEGVNERNNVRRELESVDKQLLALERVRAMSRDREAIAQSDALDTLDKLKKAAKADERTLRRGNPLAENFNDAANVDPLLHPSYPAPQESLERQLAKAAREETAKAREQAVQDAWRNRVEEQTAEKANVGARVMGAAKDGLQVADKATGAVMGLADFLSGLVSGHSKPEPAKDRGGELAGFIHDDPKLMKEQQAARSAAIRAEKQADLALERIEDDMKKGTALSASDIQNLTAAQQQTLRHFGDEGMQRLIEDLHKRNERYWSSDGGRERERD